MTMMSKNDLIKEIYDYVLDYDLDTVVFHSYKIEWLSDEVDTWCVEWEDGDYTSSLEQCLDQVPVEQLIDWYDDYIGEELLEETA